MANIKLRSGSIILYKRPESPKWQAELRLIHGTKKISCKTENEHDAASYATRVYDELSASPKPLKNTNLFSTFCKIYYASITGSNAKPFYETYRFALNRWIDPYFGKMDIHSIDDDAVSTFSKWREEQLGRVPAKATINTHNIVLRSIFEIALAKKIITRDQFSKLSIKNKGREAQARGSFSEVELMIFIPMHLNLWANASPNFGTRYKRELLKHYIAFLWCTGMRPGKEIETLRWRNIDTIFKGAKGYKRIHVQEGKTGKRSVIAKDDFEAALDRISKHTKRQAPDDLIFCMPDGSPFKGVCQMFNLFAKTYGYYTGADDRVRTLYSIRHSYLTEKVRENAIPESVLADSCGTSGQMIRKYYSDATVEDFADKFAK